MSTKKKKLCLFQVTRKGNFYLMTLGNANNLITRNQLLHIRDSLSEVSREPAYTKFYLEDVI